MGGRNHFNRSAGFRYLLDAILERNSAGTTILVASHSVYKGIQLDLVQEEVRELRRQLTRLQVREGEVEDAVARQRRQVEVLDHAYGARLPDSDSELSVYSKWFSSDLAPHHKLSAAWPGGEEAGEEYQDQPRAHRCGQGQSPS